MRIRVPFDIAHVGRTLLSVAFDFDVVLDLDREAHDFSRAAKHRLNEAPSAAEAQQRKKQKATTHRGPS
jgi:hypothetical protein